MKRTKKEAEETRRMLFEKAALVFKQEGYQKANLVDIASQVGVTRGAIARHYGDKRTLFREVIEAQMQDSVRHINETMQRSIEPEEKMDEFTKYLAANPMKMHIHISLLDNLMKEQPAEFQDLVEEVQNHYRFIHLNLEAVVKRKISSDDQEDDLHAAFIAKAIFSFINGFFIDYDHLFSLYSSEKIQSYLSSLFHAMMNSPSYLLEERF